ncbi:hypothetical protein T4E_5718 [Trichinella pseudospiralis]|uniref:Uncharacterized protein n=1 Tax=Trichinella pseudospiralis TaxID=6337 RepID=A0A0V0XH75_TRIPS|nr:hypothetical protein T4E_5718 [Trichinella pseudospiralis]
MELYPWSDGIKRSALVKIATGTLVRTIRKLQLNEPATVSVGRDEIANDAEDTLCKFLNSAQLSLRLDESTLYQGVKRECFKEKEIPLRNSIAVTTDTTLEMVGYHSGFIVNLKKSVTDVFKAHCAVS